MKRIAKLSMAATAVVAGLVLLTGFRGGCGGHGEGVVAGRSVPCLSPTTQVLCHAHGYHPTEKDRRDMLLLHKRYAVELPQAFLEDSLLA